MQGRMVVTACMAFLLYGTLTTQVSSMFLQDFSSNCKELLRSYPICSDFAMQYVCLKTCAISKEFPLSCGKRFITKNDEKETSTEGDLKTEETSIFRSKRIVGGQEAKEGSWPWQAALMFKGSQYCAGALVSPSWVVTAAHCFGQVTSKLKTDWQVVLGEHKLGTKEVFEQHRKVSKIIIHPDNFRYWKLGYPNIPDDYDIALVKLSSPAILSKRVNTVCLPNNQITFPAGTSCYIAGWGKTAWKGSQPDALREASVKLVERSVCNAPQSYDGKIHQRAICAGYSKGGVDACQYDSGGGLNCEKDGRFYVEGLVSWGKQCAKPHKYGVYTNVPLLRNWIVETVLNNDPLVYMTSKKVYSAMKSAFLKRNSTATATE